MAKDLGPGVSRTLDASQRQFSGVIYQSDKPLNDSELNLQDDIGNESLRQALKSVMPSGFLMDPTRPLNDYQFNPYWTNLFALGNPKAGEESPVVQAVVNGWTIPVVGTNAEEGDLRNLIKLFPPPESDGRIDLIFLEAWQTRIDPNPSTVNKPTASTIYKYGNTQYGGINIQDDLEDPDIGYETTGRVQIQYRFRLFGSGVGLGAGVALDKHPDGLGDPNIFGQGTNSAPVPGLIWGNMREALGDPSLWRAGDGDPNNALGTIDGYTYAIPVCAVFRRNSGIYVAVTDAGNPNQNGGFLRTPGNAFLADPLSGARLLTTATLTSDLSPTAGVLSLAVVGVTNLNGSGLEDPHLTLSSTFLVIDNEIVGISAVNLLGPNITIPAGGRGRYGTAAVGHPMGTTIKVYNSRPDGLFSDQIADTDILDLRRAINPADWDFHRLLEHNVAALVQGELRSTWKNSGSGDTEGVVVHDVDELWAGGTAHPNHTDPVDGTDGVRTVFSDAAAIQPDVTLLLDNEAALDGTNFTSDQFDTTTRWEVGPDFKPIGFMNNGGTMPVTTPKAWTNGTSILMFIGGADGTQGARGTFRDGSDRAVRFVMPKEYWKTNFSEADPAQGNQNPVSIRFIGERALEPPPPAPGGDPCLPFFEPGGLTAEQARHVGPMYPWRDLNFERPFITLGGILNPALRLSRPTSDMTSSGSPLKHEIDIGLDFDTPGGFFSKDAFGNFQNDPALVGTKLLRGQRTLYGMLTDNGRDQTGASSEIYLVIYGDTDSSNNNGAFKVIGAGTSATGYTASNASNATSLVVEPLSVDFPVGGTIPGTFDNLTGNNVVIEFRSPHHNAEDTSDFGARFADLAIVLTDIGGFDARHPWNRSALGLGEAYDIALPVIGPGPYPALRAAVPSKLLIGLTLQYHPGRGAMARVPDQIVRFSKRGGVTSTVGAYLRQSPSNRDVTFSSFSGAPANEAFWDFSHVQTWNRLPANGLHAPEAPNYGGNVVGFTEQDREHELFVDRGSKTIIFRPFRDRKMTMHSMTFTTDIVGSDCLLGPYNFPGPPAFPKDSLAIFTGTTGTGKRMGFAVPREFMPRFGRQDIPYWVDTNNGGGPFLPGINHLFRDSGTLNEPVFNVIGGSSNLSGGNQVLSMFLATGTPTLYAHSGTIVGPVNPRDIYGARRTDEINPLDPFAQEIIDRLSQVHSSDLGGGLEGIQLPPYLGISRLYGVYELSDYTAKSGRTFQSNRFKPEANPAINLLREDATQQTLFILEDGAKDLTGEPRDHTYIVPSNVLDLTRIPGFVAGQKFKDFHYVVECTVFGFARGFIDENNYVLVRKFNGAGKGALGGLNNTDGDVIELEDLHMVIPCPAASDDHFYVAYNRTVYQGDPFMSRAGEVRTTSDYEARYGQIPVASQFALRAPIQQYYSTTGEPVIETPNARAFEVLASMDFYTTLGTGKIGGQLYPGTSLDVGFTDPVGAHRMPSEIDAPPWRILPRAFSEGQVRNESRARMGIELRDLGALHPALNPSASAWAFIRFTRLDQSVVDIYASTAANNAALLLAVPTLDPATDIFEIDTDFVSREYTTFPGPIFPVSILPGQMLSPINIPLVGARIGDTVVITPDTFVPEVFYQGLVDVDDQVRLTAHYAGTNPTPYTVLTSAGLFPTPVPLGATDARTVLVPGSQVGDSVIFTPNEIVNGVFYQGHVSPPGTVILTAHNTKQDPVEFTGTLAAGAFAPATIGLSLSSQMATGTLAVAGAQVGDSVIVNPDSDISGVFFQGRVSAANTVTVTAHVGGEDQPFSRITGLFGSHTDAVVSVLVPWSIGAPISPNEGREQSVAVLGVLPGDVIAINPSTTSGAGFPVNSAFHAEVVVPGFVRFVQVNHDTNPVIAIDRTMQIAIIRKSSLPTISLATVNVSVRVLHTQTPPDDAADLTAVTGTLQVLHSDTVGVSLAGIEYTVRVMHDVGSLTKTAENLANLVNNHPKLLGTVKAYTFEDSRVDFEAVPSGALGNGIHVSIKYNGATTQVIQNALRLLVPYSSGRAVGAVVTGSNLIGGIDEPVNAGNGTNPLAMTGMTERLPLGILLQDSDFLCENPLGDEASAMQSSPVGPRPVQTLIPLTRGGEEFNRFLGSPGELVVMADGGILQYTGYSGAVPAGTKRFRLYRGGGSSFVLSGINPGGPVDWVSDSFASAVKPVLKGGALVCRAMLVRNFYEAPFSTPTVVSEGGEIQMIVVTHGILGGPETQREGVTLKGVIGPTGYGEGYAAADRYRIHGKPMFLGQSRQVPDPADVTLAVYPTKQRE